MPTTNAHLLTPDSTVSVKRLVDGDGTTFEEWIIRTFQTPWAYSEDWSDIVSPGAGVEGSLNFGTENLYLAMADSDSLPGYFEIELTDASANISTVIQAPVTIQGPVIGDGAAGLGEFGSYLTKTYESIICSVTGENANVATGDGKITWRMPYAMTLTEVRASVKTAPAGSTIDIDIEETGATVLSTLLTIDAGEKTSTTAAVPAVISDSSLADDAEMTINVDQIGSGTAGVGLKVYLNGYRT